MSLGQIIQLAALGVQNLYLNIKPQYTMFRKSYKRHTNYATQVVKVSANGAVNWGAKIDFDLTRNGDLVAETYLVVQLPCITGGVYKEEKWWPTAYKAVPGYVNPQKDFWSHRGDALSAHVGRRHEDDKGTDRVKAVLGHAKAGDWAGHPKLDGSDPATNGTTAQTGVLVGSSHSQVAYVDSLGHAIIKDARFFVAQNVIQEFTGEYMHIHHLMNNPAESLNEALFSYGDDMHAQGPQGGSLADGVGFQASKFGHGAIASGGFWVDMETTKTDPMVRMGCLVDGKSSAAMRESATTNKNPSKTERENKTNYTKLDEKATSKIGRCMAFLPLASQTYVGMCFHNASAANAHIDFADKMMDTRSAEYPYIAGQLIGSSEKSCVAIKGTDLDYSNFDGWNGAAITVAKSANASGAFQSAITAETWFNSSSPDAHFTAIRDAFKTTSGVSGAFFLVPRGIRSRSQPRGIGLHDYSGYHGSLVRVEDSVGSGTFVSDKFIGLDEFNAMATVPRVLASSSVNDLNKTDVATAAGLGFLDVASGIERSPFDVSAMDQDLYFTQGTSTRHHNRFALRDDRTSGTTLADSAIRFYTTSASPSATSEPFLKKGLSQGDAVYLTGRGGRGSELGDFRKHSLLARSSSTGNGHKVLCLKASNVTGVTGVPTPAKSLRFAVALAERKDVDAKGTTSEFSEAYDLLSGSSPMIVPGQIVRLAIVCTQDATASDGTGEAGDITTVNATGAGGKQKTVALADDPILIMANPDATTFTGASDTTRPQADGTAGTNEKFIIANFQGGAFGRLGTAANVAHVSGTQSVDGTKASELGFTGFGTGGDEKYDPAKSAGGGSGSLFTVVGVEYAADKKQVFVAVQGTGLSSHGIHDSSAAPAATKILDTGIGCKPKDGSDNTYPAAEDILDTTLCLAKAADFAFGGEAGYLNTGTRLGVAGTGAVLFSRVGIALDLDIGDDVQLRSRGGSDIQGKVTSTAGSRILLGYAGAVPTSCAAISWPGATSAATAVGDRTTMARKASYAADVRLYKTRSAALQDSLTTAYATDKVDPFALRNKQPFGGFIPWFNDITSDRSNAAVFIEPMAGLTSREELALSNKVLQKCAATLSAMVNDMLRAEFHRGAKQSGSQYFDSESTAGCGPRASLGALMYTAACAQPLGSAPACSQLASDILVPQYSDALVSPADAKLSFGTRMMCALDRSSALGKIAGVRGDGFAQNMFDHQDVETARLVKNYNPGPAYEVVSSRLDTSLYSKLRTHAQMNSGFGRRAQISATGNHQMEDGSGKCVQVVVPMPWWYAEGPACDGRRTQALPMIALQYHNVSISVNLRRLDECVQTDREHRQQPFRCSKMIGSLGKSALDDAKSQDCVNSKGGAVGFADMPTTTHGAREGSTLVDTLGTHNNRYPQERAVTCVNMHSVKHTLSGIRYSGSTDAYFNSTDKNRMAAKIDDVSSGNRGDHLIAAAAGDASTAAGYQGHVDERHHVDVGTWLNFASKSADYLNSKGNATKRNQMRIGVNDGEFIQAAAGPFKSSDASTVGALTDAGQYPDTETGDLASWGQATWDAHMSNATAAVLSTQLNKVPLAAVFGAGQTNGGFAMHSDAKAISNKLCLTGNATICAMADAVQNNEDACSVFKKATGTMGWAKKGTVSGSKSELQIIGAHLLITYIFLDSSERRLFAANAHEYLLSQVQTQEHHEGKFAMSSQPKQITMDLKFNHPVSHLFWVLQRPESQWAREWFRYEATHGGGDPLMIRAELSLNASKREEENYLNATNTTVIEPWNYFKKCNNTGIGGALKSHSHDGSAKNIHLYSFAQNPGEWYPTGSLNFSRIDRVELKLYCKGHAESHLTHPLVWGGGGYRELNMEIMNAHQTATVAGVDDSTALKAAYGELAQGVTVRVYARNFNVFRIQSGMGALKYAN